MTPEQEKKMLDDISMISESHFAFWIVTVITAICVLAFTCHAESDDFQGHGWQGSGRRVETNHGGSVQDDGYWHWQGEWRTHRAESVCDTTYRVYGSVWAIVDSTVIDLVDTVVTCDSIGHLLREVARLTKTLDSLVKAMRPDHDTTKPLRLLPSEPRDIPLIGYTLPGGAGGLVDTLPYTRPKPVDSLRLLIEWLQGALVTRLDTLIGMSYNKQVHALPAELRGK